ncbi:MAG TPA: hypothetical protein VKA82_07790 [Rubrobacter sp.]|nr:hypothetical protein [Rubrobacter sp.]
MCMFLKWKGRSGLGLVALAAGAIALGLLIATSSPAVAGSGSGSGGSSGSIGSGSSGSSSSVADFAFTANYKPPSFVGYVVRGGLPSCARCTTAVEPRYVDASFDCFYDSNTISLVSLNGFGGDVKLEVLNLPAGVTSQTATKLTVPRRGVASAPFKLQARGDATVTVRATSGSIVHALDLPISVADQLPSCKW